MSHSFIQNCCWITLQVSQHQGRKTCQKWKVKLIFRRAYRLSGTGIVECLDIVDVGCNLKQFDILTWLTLTPRFYDRSTPLARQCLPIGFDGRCRSTVIRHGNRSRMESNLNGIYSKSNGSSNTSLVASTMSSSTSTSTRGASASTSTWSPSTSTSTSTGGPSTSTSTKYNRAKLHNLEHFTKNPWFHWNTQSESQTHSTVSTR